MSTTWSRDEFRRTHELRHLIAFHPGYAAICYCGWGSGSRRLAFFAIMAHSRHRSKELKRQKRGWGAER